MKRANTIDIPKPLNFYRCDDEDTDYEDDDLQKHRSNYLALRGPIRVGSNTKTNSKVPPLEPKTENDMKFLNFINKHNETNNNPAWSNRASIWNNKFGNIKNNFEKMSSFDEDLRENAPKNPTKNFWKTADDSINRTGSTQFGGAKITKQSAKNLKQMFEDKQKEKEDIANSVVTGSLKVSTKFSEPEKNYRFVPQSLPVNKFSHAPSSAFQPISKPQEEIRVNKFKNKSPPHLDFTKTEIRVVDTKTPTTPLYLYSPKPFSSNQSSAPSSPLKPWLASSGEHRVLSMAAQKFENASVPQPNPIIRPRKLSKDNIFTQAQPVVEKLSAPYLVKSVHQKENTVRKLSGQYDHLNTIIGKDEKLEGVSNHQSVTEGFQPKFTIPQNYSIQYTHPKLNDFGQKRLSDSWKYNQNPHAETRSSFPAFEDAGYQHKSLNSPAYNTKAKFFEDGDQVLEIRKELPKPVNTYGREHVPKAVSPQYQAHSQVRTEVFAPNPNILVPKPNISVPNPNVVIPNPNILVQSSPPQVPKYEKQVSTDSVHEYNAISSRVMEGPVAQHSSTFRQKSPMTRNEHDFEAVFNLKNVLEKASKSPSPHVQQLPTSPSSSFKYQVKPDLKKSEATVDYTANKHLPFRDLRKGNEIESGVNESLRIKSRVCNEMPKRQQDSNWIKEGGDNLKNNKTVYIQGQMGRPHESLEVNERGESIVTSKFHIPALNVAKSPELPRRGHALSKSDSWHQICVQNQAATNKPSPRSSPNARTVLKSKSSHSLALPKQFEAGMTKEEMSQKRRTMEAFFGSNEDTPRVVKRSINRIKTSEKMSSIRSNPQSLSRSRTLPDIVSADLVDEDDVDRAFEDLFKSS